MSGFHFKHAVLPQQMQQLSTTKLLWRNLEKSGGPPDKSDT